MKVGDKVICVDDSNWKPEWKLWFTEMPIKGRLYVIEELVTQDGKDGIVLVGMNSFRKNCFGESCSFKPSRFRLLAEIKQEHQEKNAMKLTFTTLT